MWGTPERYDPAYPGRGICRVEVYSRGEPVAEAATVDEADLFVIGGSVKHTNAVGLTRTLTLTVEPNAQWLRIARLPKLEFRPFVGIEYSPANRLEFPMGRFPATRPKRSLPLQELQWTCGDYWSWLMTSRFPVQTPAYQGLVKNVIATLMVEAKGGYGPAEVPLAAYTGGDPGGWPFVTATSDAEMVAGLQWSGDASKAALDACQAIGGDAFFDRQGQGIVRDYVRGPGRAMSDDPETGTILSIDEGSGEFANTVVLSSSADGVELEPYRLALEDSHHPGWPNDVGHIVKGISSPLWTERDQMIAAAPAILARESSAALYWDVTALADPSIDAGDIVPVTTALGAFSCSVEEVTHDLGGGRMRMHLGAAP
jgi:hypothetical protein